jgi:hypothetical protein
MFSLSGNYVTCFTLTCVFLSMRILFVAAALAVLVHGNAWAADDEPSASEASSSSAAWNKAAPEVTVRARRTQLAPKIRAFVNDLTAWVLPGPGPFARHTGQAAHRA